MTITIGQRPDHAFDEPLGLLSDCHRRIEHFLDVLIVLDRLGDAEALSPAHRGELIAALTYFDTAAPRHTADEEDSLFPRLRASGDPSATRALDLVARLERDHAVAQAHHAAIDALGRRWIDRGRLEPAERREFTERLAALQAIYQPHIAVEDDELFPAAAGALPATQIREIGREMAARRSSPGR